MEHRDPAPDTFVYPDGGPPGLAVAGTCTIGGAPVTIRVNGAPVPPAPPCTDGAFVVVLDATAAPFVDGINTLQAQLAAPGGTATSPLVVIARDLAPLAITVTSHRSTSAPARAAAEVDPSLITVATPTVRGTCAPAARSLTISIGAASVTTQCSFEGAYTVLVDTTALADSTSYKLRARLTGTTVDATVDVFKSTRPTVHFAEVAALLTTPIAGNRRACIDCHYTKLPAAAGAIQPTPSANLSFGVWDACAASLGGKPTGAGGACEDPSNAAAYATCDDPLVEGGACLAERGRFRFQIGYDRYTTSIAAANEGAYANHALTIVNDDVEAAAPVTNRIVRGQPNRSFLYKKIAGKATAASVLAASPARVVATGHGLQIGDVVRFTAGTLPGGLVSSVIYVVLAEGFAADGFEVAAASGGPPVDTAAGTQGDGITVAGQDACTHAFPPSGTTMPAFGCKTSQGTGNRMPLLTSGKVTTYLADDDVRRIRTWILEGARTDF